MLVPNALLRLHQDLAASIASMEIGGGRFGFPEYVETQKVEAERLFQGYAKAKPNKEDAYAAASAFLRGQALDSWQRDMVATALAEPIREQGGGSVLGSPRLVDLLAAYESEAQTGELWRLTWHGLLNSYFDFDPTSTKHAPTYAGWSKLRDFLARTWPHIDRQAGTSHVPDWIGVLRSEPQVLSAKPTEKYAAEFLAGDTATTDRLATDLGIPPSSWFWHSLVLAAVSQATGRSDAEYRQLVSKLVQLVHSKPAFRDEALEQILVRYHACVGAPPDERLRDYVVQPTVWKNPKLKAAGIATAWNRVPDAVWHMVLGWVNERSLKDFFDILAARNMADEGRLAFWSRYLKQITWTRLVFGAETMALKNRNAEVRSLIAREEGSFAELTSPTKREFDAFMMQIGSFLIVEFSKKPNACYLYKADELPFEPYSRHYNGGTEDLAAGFHGTCAARIVHRDGWAYRAAVELRTLGIRPDKPEAQRALPQAPTGNTYSRVSRTEDEVIAVAKPPVEPQPVIPTATVDSPVAEQKGPDMAKLRLVVSRFRGAEILDKRVTSGGRLWVEDPLERTQLASELKSFGFKWANSRQAWYFPEN